MSNYSKNCLNRTKFSRWLRQVFSFLRVQPGFTLFILRFTEENDQQRALIEMQHFPGISRRPIRVSLATPKRY
jgi:hypothetical protein